MVKIETLANEGKVSKIRELELERYLNFFENSYKDNLSHCKRNVENFQDGVLSQVIVQCMMLQNCFLQKNSGLK